MDKIKITYFGHACFTLEYGGYTVCIDPYDPSVPGYPPLCVTANKTLCSHSHHDHNYLEAVCMPLNDLSCPFEIEALACFHDEKGGALRGENKIHVFSAGGMRIAHMGDLGHVPDADLIKHIGKLDLLMIPVGGTYTVDPKGANNIVNLLEPRITVPMHYRRGKLGYDVIAHIDEFLSLRNDVRHHGNKLELSSDLAPGTVVMDPVNE